MSFLLLMIMTMKSPVVLSINGLIVKSMTIEQLREFKSAFEKKKKVAFEPVPQLYCKQDKRNNTVENGQFSI